MYDKRDDFSCPIVNYPLYMVMFPCHHLMVFIYLIFFDSLVYVTMYLILTKEISVLLKNYYTRVFDITDQSKHLLNFIIGRRTSFVNRNQHADILYVQIFYIQSFVIIFYKYKAQKCRHQPQKLTKSLNRLTKKGYSYDTVIRS